MCIFILTSVCVNILGIEYFKRCLRMLSFSQFFFYGFKLYFLFWHGTHLQRRCRKGLSSCIWVTWYVINPWFYGQLYVSLREGDVFLLCPDRMSCSQHVLTCSVPAWWNPPGHNRNFCTRCLCIIFNKFCALNIFKGCFSVKWFWIDGSGAFGYALENVLRAHCSTLTAS
jgi:hypothetical protein